MSLRRQLATTVGAVAAILALAATLPSIAGEPGAGPERRNRLAEESSPYLLLHQSNPVDWYPWGDEALSRAQREDKPIFLSVGYSTCFWCHVMERKVFSDPEIAEVMNERFINIKVDREERPDLDEIYMAATQIITRSGGWPNSVFLTPELAPFFAGTYFAPEDGEGRPGFPTVLAAMSDAWENRREEVEAQAARISGLIGRWIEENAAPAAEVPPVGLADAAIDGLERSFDAEHGGFGKAPKFPSPANLFLLLDVRAEDAEADAMLATTLDQMARGGIYDQLGGGFHRYATDAAWRVPHFEKMLYDNGLLLEVYAHWFAASADPQAARVVRETTAFLEREMTSKEGAFYSAIDAETDGHEGAFYVWTRRELDDVLGDQIEWIGPIFGLDAAPNFEGDRYVLHLPKTFAAQAARPELSSSRVELLGMLEPHRKKLLARRAERQRPRTDDKILVDWNGMTIAGLAVAGKALGEPDLVARAERAADFVLREMGPTDGRPLQHSWRGGRARIDAYLGDYAFFVRGLLALHRATGEAKWLAAAGRLTDEQIRRLSDPRGGFFVAGPDPSLLFRSKDASDGAIPGANAIAILNLVELSERTGEARWRKEAERALRAFGPAVQRAPVAYRSLALALRRFHATAATTTDASGSPSIVDRRAPVVP